MGKELTATQQKALTVRDYINQPHIVKQLQAALPSFIDPERFLRTCWTAMLRNPPLLDCTKESMLGAMIESAQLGLEPVLGKAALIPYAKEMQFQPMYRGLIDLGRRTGDVKITGHVVYEKDEFELAYGINEVLVHIPTMEEDPGEMVGAYTVWTFENGVQTFLFMPTHQIHKARAKSQAWKKAQAEPNNKKAQETPWVQWADQQSIKTVIKRHSKLQPASIEMERAIELDNRVELGKSQADILGQFDFATGAPPVTEPEKEEPAQHLIDKFDLKIKEKENVDLANLNEYLTKVTRTKEGLTINDVKAHAIKHGFDSRADQKPAFWDYYTDWEGYKPAAKGETGKKKTEYSAFQQQFMNKRKGDEKTTGLVPFILQNRGLIEAAPIEDQEAIRKKFYTLYPRETPYPLAPITAGGQEGDPGPGDDNAPPDKDERKNTEVTIACPFEDIRSVQEPKNDPERVYESFCRVQCRNRCSTYINYVRDQQDKESG